MEDWVYLCEKEIKKERDLRNIRGLKRISSYLIHLLIKTYEKIGELKGNTNQHEFKKHELTRVTENQK